MATSKTVKATVKGGKSGKTRTRRGFWDRALQAPKVREALAKLEVSEETFEKHYNATRKSRETREISETEVAALKVFAEDRNLGKLATAIGKSDLTAANLLARAMVQGIL